MLTMACAQVGPEGGSAVPPCLDLCTEPNKTLQFYGMPPRCCADVSLGSGRGSFGSADQQTQDHLVMYNRSIDTTRRRQRWRAHMTLVNRSDTAGKAVVYTAGG